MAICAEERTVFGTYPEMGFVSIFYSTMESPLSIWEKQERRGEIRRIVDEDGNLALGLISQGNIHATFITTPSKAFVSLGIFLPCAVLVLKNVGKSVAFTVQIRDDYCTRRFLFSNAYRTSRIKSFSSLVPITLETGWNQLSVDLRALVYKTYGTNYQETVRVQVHANCRLRLIYFCAELVETPQAVEIMKTILSQDSSSSFPQSPSPLTESQVETFIEKSLSWRKRLAAQKAKSVFFDVGIISGLDVDKNHNQGPASTKSCPVLDLNVEYDTKRLINEEVRSMDDAACRIHDGLESSETELIKAEHCSDEHLAQEIDTALKILRSWSHLQPITVTEEHPEIRSSLPEDETEAAATSTLSPPQEPHDALLPPQELDDASSPPLEEVESAEISTQTAISSAIHTQRLTTVPIVSKASVSDLDEQLANLESLLYNMLNPYPSTGINSDSPPVPTSSISKMDQLRGRIDEMKLKLRTLEETFENEQLQDDRTPYIPILSLQSPTSTPSGILRIPGTSESSCAKLKPKLSVRFASDEEWPEGISDLLTSEMGVRDPAPC